MLFFQPKAGQTHYENLCMKAVNQSIGKYEFLRFNFIFTVKSEIKKIFTLASMFALSNAKGARRCWSVIETSSDLTRKSSHIFGKIQKMIGTVHTSFGQCSENCLKLFSHQHTVYLPPLIIFTENSLLHSSRNLFSTKIKSA